MRATSSSIVAMSSSFPPPSRRTPSRRFRPHGDALSRITPTGKGWRSAVSGIRETSSEAESPGDRRVMPGELHALLERCRAEDAPAWERFAEWVKTRSRAILGGVDKLTHADGEDALADALRSLVAAVRRGE